MGRLIVDLEEAVAEIHREFDCQRVWDETGEETADPRSDKMYSSREVRRFVDVSYENGKRAGIASMRQIHSQIYNQGYNAGLCEGTERLYEFQEVLKSIMNLEKEESNGD